MVDIHAVLPGPLALGSDTPAPISFGCGGSAANTAAWLGSLGVPCVFVGRVGADPFGLVATGALRSHGVLAKVSIDPEEPTGACLVLVGPDGERTMIPSAGANARLSESDLGTDLLMPGDHLHLSGYTLLNEGSRSAARFALSTASRLGASVSVDAASAAPIRSLGGELFLDWVPAGALLLANADEVAALTRDIPDGVQLLLERGIDVVVKNGAAGARLATVAGSWQVPAVPVEAVDSTGAGDAFAAGLLAALHGGSALIEAVLAGNRTGALAVRAIGGRPR